MKKLLLLVLLLPAMFLMGACSDENDLAEVDISLQLSGVTVVDNQIYAVEGSNVAVESLNVTSLTDKNAVIQRVLYQLDGYPLPINLGNPFTTSINTEGFRIGRHELGFSGVVLQVDKELTNIQAIIPFNVVESEENLPEGAPEIGTYTINVTPTQSK